jgi:hypothetical protein
MWLRFSAVLVLVTALYVPTTTAAPPMKLTDRDRASIVASVVRRLFTSNFEGERFILADGLRAEWIPTIPGYDVKLVTREQLQNTTTHIFYYVIQLRPEKRSVHVTVTAYDTEKKDKICVELHYSDSRRWWHGWRGKYLWGGSLCS